jgi:hypothetical protein
LSKRNKEEEKKNQCFKVVLDSQYGHTIVGRGKEKTHNVERFTFRIP